MTTKNNQTGELSYFGLSLKSYLIDSHPDKASDPEFIFQRADRAAEAYSETIKGGHSHIQAEEIASSILYEGLRFSVYNTLVNIIWDEFSVEIPEDEARQTALLVLPHCVRVLAKYTLTDDFADTPQYDLLYTELTGVIQIWLEDGVQ